MSDHEQRMQILERLLLHLCEGHTLRDFCRIEGNPKKSTLYLWINQLEREQHEWVGRFVRARAMGYDSIAEEMLEIADTEPATASTFDEDGNEISSRIDPGDVQHRKLQIETRAKLLAKWDPGRYGERLEVEHKADESFVEVLEAARLRAARAKPVAEEGDEDVD